MPEIGIPISVLWVFIMKASCNDFDLIKTSIYSIAQILIKSK